MAMDNIENKGSRVAARGTVHLLIGRVYFMAAGYVIAVILARGLGPVAYGVYGLIMSMLLWLEVASDFGVQRATIKLIPQSENAGAVARTSAACLLTVTMILFAICWVAAPAIARSFDIENGAWLVRIAILDIPVNGLYLAYQGILQGHRRFGTVSVALILYSSAKVGGIILLLAIGVSVASALIVNVLATVAALLFLVTRYRPGIGFSDRAIVHSIVKVAIPIGVYIVTNRFVLSSHLWALPWLGGTSDESIGLYVAAWNVAQLPTVVTFVITGVLLASVSGALGKNDRELAHRYLQSACRFVIIVLAPMCVLGALDATPIMEFIFSADYAGGGQFLAMLLCAYGLFAILDTLMHAMLAADQYRKVAAVQFTLIPIALFCNYVFIPRFSGTGAATALLLTLGCGVAIAITWSARTYGSPISIPTLVRVIAATLVVSSISWFWDVSGFTVLVKLACLVVAYGGTLFLLRELTASDLRPMALWKKS
jgi:O-antigen/teichoic acid export membrane protein